MTKLVTDEAVERALKTWFDDEYPPSTLADKEWLSDMRRVLEQFAASAPEPCEYCGPGVSTGLPGNACENCMNTGLKYPAAASAPVAPQGEWVMVPRGTLHWWRELVDINPSDLAPRMDAMLAASPPPVADAVMAEREACAQIASSVPSIARAIRARSEP